MAKNDMEVIVYKILSYLYECMKNGTTPEMEDMCHKCKLFRIPRNYWLMIMKGLIDSDYITGFNVLQTKDGPYILMLDNVGITLKGREYLCENSRMKEAAEVCGAAFKIVLESVIAALLESQRA